MYLALSIYLFACSIFDVMYKKIPSCLLYSGLLCSVLYLAKGTIEGQYRGETILLAFVPGIIMLLYSKATKEKIGYGDGILVLTITCIGSLKSIYIIILGSFFLAFIFSVFLLCNKENRKKEFPFSPFLLLSSVLVLFLLR